MSSVAVGHAVRIAARAQALNPHVHVTAIAARVTADQMPALLSGISVVIDGSDNFATRLAVADAANAARFIAMGEMEIIIAP